MSESLVSTESKSDTSQLSAPGRALTRLKTKIVAEWERRIRAEIDGAKDVAYPILVDTISPYLDKMARALTPALRRSGDGADASALAQEHGGDRARLTFYDPDELVREYQLLKDVIFEFLEADVELSTEDRWIIDQSIDAGLREAVTAFALIQSEVRQQFTATLTHDLRSPIATIKMAAELLGDEIRGNADAESLLVRIVNNAKRADGMIQNLLDATAFRAGGRLRLELSQTDVRDVARNVVNELSLSHADRFDLVGESVTGRWGVDALTRALENLCNNAIKYGDPGSVVTVRTTKQNDRMILSVHNHGTPIPAAEQEAIFQAYRRANSAQRENKKGWGLGLALARGVAESHGGSLLVDSAQGRGTTFSINIPLDATPFQAAAR